MNYKVININIIERPNNSTFETGHIDSLQYGTITRYLWGRDSKQGFNLLLTSIRIDMNQTRLTSPFYALKKYYGCARHYTITV